MDKAVVESFFGHLKAECTRQHRVASVAELETLIAADIAWYNAGRISITLGNWSPVQYRAQTLAV